MTAPVTRMRTPHLCPLCSRMIVPGEFAMPRGPVLVHFRCHAEQAQAAWAERISASRLLSGSLLKRRDAGVQ